MTESDNNNSDRSWEISSKETAYNGFYRIDKVQFRHTFHRGGWTDTLDHELFVRGNVTGVLPYDPKTDQVVLVEQFRIGAMHQKPSPWQMEVIAGMMEADEQPAEVAVREANEEAGLELRNVELVRHYLGSPGSTTEEVFIFFAETDLSNTGGLHGLAEENEDIRVHVVTADDAINMMQTRQIRNAISIIALQWLHIRRLQGGIA